MVLQGTLRLWGWQGSQMLLAHAQSHKGAAASPTLMQHSSA